MSRTLGAGVRNEEAQKSAAIRKRLFSPTAIPEVVRSNDIRRREAGSELAQGRPL